MQNIRPNFSRLIAFVIFGIVLGSNLGCGTTSGPPTTSTGTIPKAGSIFITHGYSIDSTGAKISGSDYYDTDKVIASGVTYQGKTNMSRFHNTKVTTDFLLHYESNGDVSFYADNYGKPGSRSGWVTIPLGSRGKSTFVSFDSTDGSGSEIRETESYTYTGEETVAPLNQAFHTQTFDYEYDMPNGVHDPVQKYWFAPEIGYFVMSSQPPGLGWNGNKVEGDYSELVSYVLK